MESSTHTSSSQPSTATTTSSTTTIFTSTMTTDSELRSEELSGIETTIPTDLTFTPESDNARFIRPNAVTKQLLERKQLLHDLQLLKIELSQKNFIIENLKADFMSQTEETEEKLAEAVHARQMIQAMFEARMNIQEDEMRQKLEENKLEMIKILQNQKDLEEKNAKLADKFTNDRRMLYNLELKEEEFLELQKKDPEQLSLKDHVKMKIYEVVWPYKSELESLREKFTSLIDTNKKLNSETEDLNQKLEVERKKASLYRLKSEEQQNSLKELESHLKHDNYKVNNFDQIKSERDKYMEEVYELHKKISVLEATNASLNNEMPSLKSENTALQQKSVLLQQDKDYFCKRLQDVVNQNKILEDQLSKTNLQLEKMTIARDEIYERYANARDVHKTDFDRKLKKELDMIQNKTWSEIELLRRTARDIYEQEIKSLKHSRDYAISEKLTAEAALKHNLEKCEKYLEEIHILKGGGDSELLNLRNQLLVKGFEVEQLKLVSSESQKHLKECQIENEKLLKKIEVFESEIKRLEAETSKRINELESKLSLATSKLSSYEVLERDLDEAVMDAAEASADDNEGQLVASFGDQASITTSIKRRLQHSFQLAKRILVLEKLNSKLKIELQNERQVAVDLAEEVENTNRLVNDLGKPNSYLIDTIRTRDKMIKQHRENITKLENELVQMKTEKEQLRKKIELLSADMEHLLRNREEITKMKKLLTSFFPQLSISHPETQQRTPVQKKILPKGKCGPTKVAFR